VELSIRLQDQRYQQLVHSEVCPFRVRQRNQVYSSFYFAVSSLGYQESPVSVVQRVMLLKLTTLSNFRYSTLLPQNLPRSLKAPGELLQCTCLSICGDRATRVATSKTHISTPRSLTRALRVYKEYVLCRGVCVSAHTRSFFEIHIYYRHV